MNTFRLKVRVLEALLVVDAAQQVIIYVLFTLNDIFRLINDQVTR